MVIQLLGVAETSSVLILGVFDIKFKRYNKESEQFAPNNNQNIIYNL